MNEAGSVIKVSPFLTRLNLGVMSQALYLGLPHILVVVHVVLELDTPLCTFAYRMFLLAETTLSCPFSFSHYANLQI